MPTTMTADDPRRWPSVLMPTLATDAARRPARVAAIQAANNAASTSAACHGSAIQATSTTATSRINRKVFMASPSATRQGVDDVQTHGAPGRQRAHQHADAQHQRQA